MVIKAIGSNQCMHCNEAEPENVRKESQAKEDSNRCTPAFR
jgi:hypothetical protein